jgi:hypothetical protein
MHLSIKLPQCFLAALPRVGFVVPLARRGFPYLVARVGRQV